MVVWFNAEPGEPGHSYLLKHTSRTVRATAEKIHYRINVNTLLQEPASALKMNDIAYVEFETAKPLFFDPYTSNRIAGSFILIDPISNATLGAGMIREDLSDTTAVTSADDLAKKPVTSAERYKRHGHHPGLIVVENNLTLAARIERALFDDHVEVLHVSAETLPLAQLESNLKLFQSLGIVVIYSSAALAEDAKGKLKVLAGNCFLDLATLESGADPLTAVAAFTRSVRTDLP
jgi:hypothetical protein